MIRFIVYGHPVGYTRTTQRAKYSRSYQRYMDYKDSVVAAFLEQVPGEWGHPKPLTTAKGSKTFVFTKTYFGKDRPPDASNVHKCVEDALFEDDNCCEGLFRFDFDFDNPRVEVQIR